jgi:hypothetical protein
MYKVLAELQKEDSRFNPGEHYEFVTDKKPSRNLMLNPLEVMNLCWNYLAKDRPSFEVLEIILDESQVQHKMFRSLFCL